MAKIWNEKTVKERMLQYIKVAEEYYKKDFTENFPKVLINESKKITRNFGMFRTKVENGRYYSYSLEISRYLINKYNDELIDKVVGHEVAHYITFELFGTGHKHNKVFKEVCKNISKLGVEIDGSALVKDSEKYIREDYIESKKEVKEIENPKKVRYIQTCPECNYSWHSVYKVARKDSIKKWTQNWCCKKHGHKLVVFDIVENLKYWSTYNTRTKRWSLSKKRMTFEEIEKCNNMLNS